MPTYSASPNLVVTAVGTDVNLKITNPLSNAYAITAVTVITPTGWQLTSPFGACAGYLPTLSASPTPPSSAGFQCTGSLPPGLSTTITLKGVVGVASPATAAPPTGTFQTALIDAGSSPASYPGPTFSILSIASTIVTVSGTSTPFTAGGAAQTVTAALSSGQPGVPVNWSFANPAYPTATLANGNANPGGTLTPSSGLSTASGAQTTFAPSDFAGDSSAVTATLGTSAIAGSSAAVVTQAGAPSALTVSASGSATKTGYIGGATGSGTPGWTGAGLMAKIASGGITSTLADAFGNTVATGITIPVCTMVAFGGFFDNNNTQATSDTYANHLACTGTGAASNQNYYQGLTYGTSAYIQVSMTGKYNGNSFSATGNSQTQITSTMDTAASNPVCTGGVPNCTAAQNVVAGTAAGVVSTITLTYTLTTTKQVGVPVTFLALNATGPALGSFVGGTAAFHRTGEVAGAQPANVTVASSLNSAGNAIAVATFTVDPYVGDSSITFKAQLSAPTTVSPSAIVGPSSGTFAVTTTAGNPAKLTLTSYFSSTGGIPPTFSGQTTKSVAGQNVYLNVGLVDFWANPVTCTASICGAQLGIQLTASPSGSGTFSQANPSIQQGAADTAHTQGAIIFAISSSAALGAVTITMAGLYSGSGTLTIVSPNPTIKVNTPSGTFGHTVYSKFSGIGFSGTSAVSAGYYSGAPSPVTISSVTYSIDGATAVTTSGTTAWTAVPTFSNGLHTIKFTVTDSNGATASNSTSVLVDTAAPTITNPTTLAYGAGSAIVFTVVDSEGDLKSVSATVNGTALAASQVSITSGTNNPGSSVTYSVSVTGLSATTGHYGLALTATDWAGNSKTGSTVVVQVTVQQAQSLVIQGTPTSGKVGIYEGVTASYQNVWSSSQNVVVFAVWKNSLGQTMYISASSYNLASGQTQTGIFLPEIGLASGTYTVSLFVWTTSGTSVSVSTPVTVTF